MEQKLGTSMRAEQKRSGSASYHGLADGYWNPERVDIVYRQARLCRHTRDRMNMSPENGGDVGDIAIVNNEH